LGIRKRNFGEKIAALYCPLVENFVHTADGREWFLPAGKDKKRT